MHALLLPMQQGMKGSTSRSWGVTVFPATMPTLGQWGYLLYRRTLLVHYPLALLSFLVHYLLGRIFYVDLKHRQSQHLWSKWLPADHPASPQRSAAAEQRTSADCARVVMISDTHLWHRQMYIPPGDILLHGGDFLVEGRNELSHLQVLQNPSQLKLGAAAGAGAVIL